jgi:hypothetical protein
VADDLAITLTWTPTREDWERSVRVWRDVSGAARLRRIWGVVLILLGGSWLAVGLRAIAAGQSGALPWLLPPIVVTVLGIMNVTDLTGAFARARSLSKSPALLLPTSVTLTDADVFGGTALASQRFPWDFWAAVITLPDMLLLSTGVKVTETLLTLPRRGLLEPDQWDEMVTLVESNVPRHPRSPDR